MNYKLIIKNRRLRFTILKILSFIPDYVMLNVQYRIKFGRWPNLKNPKRYTEKIQCYKMYYRNPLMPQCVDKYQVRNYVREKGLPHILNEVYGIYNRAEEIQFENLPENIVIKTTDGGGGNNVLILKEGMAYDKTTIIALLNSWLGVKDVNPGREWAYTGNKNSYLIVEKRLSNNGNYDGDIRDYKFICFDGKCHYIWLDIDRFSNHHRNFYDRDWTFLDVQCEYPVYGNKIEKPVKLDEMIKYAELLSKDFPHVRVDLYYVNNKIIFGEMTFYTNSGYSAFIPDHFDFELGKLFTLY